MTGESAGRRWPMQGEDVKVSEANVFANQQIESFLHHDDTFFLIASKGMGKTLLLKYKRMLVERNNGIRVIPSNKQLDYVRLPDVLPDEWYVSLTDSRFWAHLWEMSLALSLCLHYDNMDFEQPFRAFLQRAADCARLPEDIRQGFRHKLDRKPCVRLSPSQVLARLLSMRKGAYHTLRDELSNDLFHIYTQMVHSGYAVFIDSFDHTLADTFAYDKEIWVNGQLGLLLACWEMNRQNAHIKIYSSIRQEAYAAYKGEHRLAMRGAVLLLRYRRSELRAILDKQIKCYEKLPSLEKMLGLETVANGRLGTDEPAFDYLCRHTLGTPRGVTFLGSSLTPAAAMHRQPRAEREDWVRSVINEAACNDLFHPYLEGEVRHLLDFFHSPERLALFFNNLPRNILTLADLERLRARLATLLKSRKDSLHPFCELFNIGIIGTIRVNPQGDGRRQYFRKPYEFDWEMRGILPGSPYFLVHPAAQEAARHWNPNYYSFPEVLVGDDHPWTEADDRAVEKATVKVFISYSSKNGALVGRFEQALARQFDARGVPCDIWRDKWRMVGGGWIQDTIGEAVADADYVLPILSREALASGWVEREWKRKLDEELRQKRVRVIPLRVGDVAASDLPDFLRDKFSRVLPDAGQRQSLAKAAVEVCADILAHRAAPDMPRAA